MGEWSVMSEGRGGEVTRVDACPEKTSEVVGVTGVWMGTPTPADANAGAGVGVWKELGKGSLPH